MFDGGKKVKNIFGHWCHKIIPLIYDDSLSYYEVLCKLTYKINEVIDSINGIIDGDIEGYLKKLIDDYTASEVNKLIDEIGEERVKEIAERIVQEELDGWIARLEAVEKEIPVVKTSGTKTALFNREHYQWCGNPDIGSEYKDSRGVLLNKCDLALVDDTYYYYFINSSSSSGFFKIFKVARNGYTQVVSEQYSKSNSSGYGYGHGTIYKDKLCTINHSYSLFFFNKGSNGNAPYYERKIDRDSSVPDLGRIAYDSVTDKLYACGTMAYGNNYSVYELTIHEDTVPATYTAELLFSYSNRVILGIAQNMTCYNGILYVIFSNPNQIACIDIEQKKVINVVNIDYRLDEILPVGEGQGICYNNGKIFISGYNSRLVSGANYLNVIGSVDIEHGTFLNNQSVTRSPGSRTANVIYVDRNPNAVTVTAGHGLEYDRFKTACGWSGEYDYLPFYNLWEGVECALSLYAKTGIKCRINIGAINGSTGNHMTWGETFIPAWAISDIYGYTPNGGVYATVRFLIVSQGTVNLHRIGFVGNRGTIGNDNIAFLKIEGATMFLDDCQFIHVHNSIVESGDFRAMIHCGDNGNCLMGEFHSPVGDFGVGGTYWYGTMPDGTYFVEVNSGFVNYGVGGNSSYIDLKNRRVALGEINTAIPSYPLLEKVSNFLVVGDDGLLEFPTIKDSDIGKVLAIGDDRKIKLISI